MNNFAPGQLVVAQSHRISFLNGMVGEIKQANYSWVGDWDVFFPQLKGQPCPGCGQHPDDGLYPCFTHELKPLNDPDEAMETETAEDLETCNS